MILLQAGVLIVLSYLYGSIPFGVLLGKLRGVDVTKTGTGNIGATNVLISAGFLPSIVSLFLDISKGALPILLARYFIGIEWVAVFCGFAGVVGHDFSIFLNFKGGKGVASSGGAMLVIDPVLTIIMVLFWPLIFVVWKYFIPSTLLIFLALPLFVWLVGHPLPHIVFACMLTILAFIAHRKDVARFIAGEEKEAENKLLQKFKFKL